MPIEFKELKARVLKKYEGIVVKISDSGVFVKVEIDGESVVIVVNHSDCEIIYEDGE